MRRILSTVGPLAVACAMSCGPRQSTPPVAEPPAAPRPEPAAEPAQTGPKIVEKSLADVGLDASAIDRSIKPCDDFYQYACGGWLARTEIPADKARWTRSFDEINERNLVALRAIVEEAAKSQASDPITQKVGAFYGACMDEAAIEQAGIKPIEPLLATAWSVKDAKSLTKAVAELHKKRIWALFDTSSTQDARDATLVIAVLDQNGLGLPDRDYYLKDDDRSKSIRATYLAHVEKMLTLAGLKPKKAKQAAKDVMTIETELAKVSKTKVERRDPEGMYNRVERAGLAKAAPKFDWDLYFQTLGHDPQPITVTSVPYFEGMNKLLASVKPEAWRHYLTWHVVHQTSDLLPRAFVDESFSLRQALTGQPKIEERWKRCLYATNDGIGELLGQLFVRQYFGPEAKAAVEKMVAAIRAAFGETLKDLEWMDAPTRERALKKLSTVAFQIGYPARWREYTFEVDPKAYAANDLAAREFETHRWLDKIGKPVDRDDWFMTPQTVNAYYQPEQNKMVFPAGILQPPFFNAKAPFHVNLGAMGMVVGHELTHGFDDEGSQFDADGNLRSWWEPDIRKKFEEKAACVIAQYDGYEALPGLKLNGKLTLGENIADNAGLELAYQAMKVLQAESNERIVAEGYTEEQQFFLSMAQMWCSEIRDEEARRRVLTDPHSAAKFRVNGPLSNLPAFWDAFSCPAGSPMRAEKPCDVW